MKASMTCAKRTGLYYAHRERTVIGSWVELPLREQHRLKNKFFSLILWVTIFAFSILKTAHGCSLNKPLPEKTLADHIIDNDLIVLARGTSAKPFSYTIVEVLKGSKKGKPPNIFIDGPTRRAFASNPNRYSVLAYSNKNEKWHTLVRATNAEFETVVRKIVSQAPKWQTLDVHNKERIAFFAPLLNHPDREIHELAYLEISRSPYREIKKISKNVSRKQVRSFLSDHEYIEWHALYILILALNSDIKDQQAIRKKAAFLTRHKDNHHLSAWFTAYVEVDREAAIRFIEKTYFRDKKREKQELVDVVKALSIHGNQGHTHLRDTIVESYGNLLDTHPFMAEYVVEDLIAWQREDLSGPLSKILIRLPAQDSPNASAIKRYLLFAENLSQKRG